MQLNLVHRKESLQQTTIKHLPLSFCSNPQTSDSLLLYVNVVRVIDCMFTVAAYFTNKLPLVLSEELFSICCTFKMAEGMDGWKGLAAAAML